MNAADIIILAIVALAVVFAVLKIRKNKGNCSCGCGGCEKSKSCCRKDSGRSGNQE